MLGLVVAGAETRGNSAALVNCKESLFLHTKSSVFPIHFHQYYRATGVYRSTERCSSAGNALRWWSRFTVASAQRGLPHNPSGLFGLLPLLWDDLPMLTPWMVRDIQEIPSLALIYVPPIIMADPTAQASVYFPLVDAP